MPTFESDKHSVGTTPMKLITFLAKPANLKEILPEDRIENWKTEGNNCSFKIKGLAEISLQLDTQNDNEVVYKSGSDKPFPFKLIVRAEGEDPSELSATFDADVNSFMSMMLKAPLTNFLNSLGESLKKKFG